MCSTHLKRVYEIWILLLLVSYNGKSLSINIKLNSFHQKEETVKKPTELLLRCFRYIYDVNVIKGNSVMIVQNKMMDYELLRHLMELTNIFLYNFGNNDDDDLDSNQTIEEQCMTCNHCIHEQQLPPQKKCQPNSSKNSPQNSAKENFSSSPNDDKPDRKWKTFESFQHKLGTISFYVIQSDSLCSLKLMLCQLNKTMEFNSRANFIVLMNSSNDTIPSTDYGHHQKPIEKERYRSSPDGEGVNTNNQNILTDTFQILWHFNIFNAIIIFCGTTTTVTSPSSSSTESCGIYTWFPYDKDSLCGKRFSNFKKIDECFLFNDYLHVNYMLKYPIHYSNETNSNYPVPSEIKSVQFSTTKTITLVKQNATVFFNSLASTDEQKMQYQTTFNSQKYLNYFHNIKYPTGVFEYRENSPPPPQQISLSSIMPTPSIVDGISINNLTTLDPSNRMDYNLRNDTIKMKINWRTPHFFDTIPSNLNGCQFKCVLFIWPPFITRPQTSWIGIEHKLFLDISRFMNFQIIEHYVESTVLDETNDIAKQLVTILNYNMATMMFGNIYPNIEAHQLLDYSIGYLYDKINWIVPLAEPKPIWLNFINCIK